MTAIVAACSSAPPSAQSRFAGTTAPLPATQPHLVVDAAGHGWAVWPSGGVWVLLETSDGFAHVRNRTPVAVETAGGLIVGAASGHAAVAIGTHEGLTRSPLLTSSGDSPWTPDELPGAVADSRTAVEVGGPATQVVLTDGGGRLVARDATGWQTVTSAAALAAPGELRMDGVTWAGTTLGWVTGHDAPGTSPRVATAFGTTDGGRTWTPVPGSGGTAVASLAPCGEAMTWVMPTIRADGTISVLRTVDGGASWSSGAPVDLPAGAPAWGCHGDRVWLAGRRGGTDRVFSSTDGGRTWADTGATPADLTDLTPTGGGVGFAASGSAAHPRLWAVSGNGDRFSPVPLPSWVAALGGAAPGD